MKKFHTIYTSGETEYIVLCRKSLLNSKCLIIMNFRNNSNSWGDGINKLYT